MRLTQRLSVTQGISIGSVGTHAVSVPAGTAAVVNRDGSYIANRDGAVIIAPTDART